MGSALGTDSSNEVETPPWLQSEEQLAHFLEGHGIDTALLGTGSAKSLASLLQELQTQACFLEVQSPEDGAKPPAGAGASVVRIVEPVFIRFRWRSNVLVQESQMLNDGRKRSRRRLFAVKKEPRDGGGLYATIVRGIHEEFGIDPSQLEGDDVLRYRPDTYQFEIERINSPSYPGIPSVYRTHYVQVDILEGGSEAFKECNLSEMGDFATKRTTELGTTTYFWKWHDIAVALREDIVGFPPTLLSMNTLVSPPEDGCATSARDDDARMLSTESVPDAETLAQYLTRAGIDPSIYGVGKAKPVSALLKEMQKGESQLEWYENKSTMRRIAEPVFIQLRWGDRVLVEVEQHLAGGQVRKRNMLLAEKKSPEDADVAVTALRGIGEELNLPSSFPALDSVVRFMHEAYCCMAETLESSSYPGLPCVYVTHYCTVEVLDAGLPHFDLVGMLADEFDTQEADKINKWRWVQINDARRMKVKGFPALQTNEQEDADSVHCSYAPLSDVPLDAAGLRVLLEIGGVSVNAWGKYATASLASLAAELKNGTSQLEREVKNGKVRRVIQSSLVQLKVQESLGPSSDLAGDANRSRNSLTSFGLEEAKRTVQFRLDLMCYEVEHPESASYPGLPCCHQTKLVQFHRTTGKERRKSTCIDNGTGSLPCGFDLRQSTTGGGEAAPPEPLPTLLDAGRKSAGPNKRVSELSERRGLSELPQGRLSALSLPALDIEDVDSLSPKSRSLHFQLRSLRRNLRFCMVANERMEAAPKPAERVVTCACNILLIRNINPLNATFQCRFTIFLEWIDEAAIGCPLGKLSEEKRKELSVPEIVLQNTLATSLEVYSQPTVVDSRTGHVACRVLYQALVQMELNMRLFPFDTQRLVLVLGLRARRDRNRAIHAQFCEFDRQIWLDEWKLLTSFCHADRPDGRARVQFGVVIGRGYWYYVVNVLVILPLIASQTFQGYFLPEIFDRLRFAIAILFAQTTFKLSIENKLPKVAYATAFDQYALFCQLITITIIVVNVAAALVPSRAAADFIDIWSARALAGVWVLGNVIWVRVISWLRHKQHLALGQIAQSEAEAAPGGGLAPPDGAAADTGMQQQLSTIQAGLYFPSATHPRRISAQTSVRAVSLGIHVWLIHDIDPISAVFECKFTVHMEWFDDKAIGMPEHVKLAPQQLKALDIPELDMHNKVELTVEHGPSAYVLSSVTGQVLVSFRYHAKLQLRLNLRRFPFDSQRLPVNLTMPNEKDRDRTFVFQDCQVAPLAKQFDEWRVVKQEAHINCMENLTQASFEICIQRHSKYYIVNVFLVLFGISSLVFTTFVIDVDGERQGFVDQGKILVPLFMTLLGFKLSILGKIPKVAHLTILDQYMIICELVFFLASIMCAGAKAIADTPSLAATVHVFQRNACVVLMSFWLFSNIVIALEVWFVREEEQSLQADQFTTAKHLQQQSRSLTSEPMLANLLAKAPLRGASSAVQLHLHILNVHSVNPASDSFFCEFRASVSWLDPFAKGLPAGSNICEDDLGKLQQPKLMVQNALTCITKPLAPPEVIDSETGHVQCQLHVKTRLQMHFKLSHFPFDEQLLTLVLALPEPGDMWRQLVLERCDSANSVKIGEWSVLGVFVESEREGGINQVVFGVKIQRSRCYYVTSLLSMCVWSLMVFTQYVLEVDEFFHRGKILVIVLMVQVVAKLAVSSKLPHIARTTAYDMVALNNLALLTCVGISAAICCGIEKSGFTQLSRATIERIDQGSGALQFLAWAVANARVMHRVRGYTRRRAPSTSDVKPEEASSPLEDPASPEPPPALDTELSVLRREGSGEGGRAASDTESNQSVALVPARKSSEERAVSLGVKIWIVSDIDVSSATFECKFHVFLDWLDPEAVGCPDFMRFRSRGGGSGGVTLDIPRVVVRNAISIVSEEHSDVQVVNSDTGHVSYRVQYHARVYNSFDLRCFPFDAQRLEVMLDLDSQDRFFIHGFTGINDQQTYLNGWRVAFISMDYHGSLPRQASIIIVVERDSKYFVLNVFGVLLFFTMLMFSLAFLMSPDDFAKRLVDMLKIVLTQTTFRFSQEHKLPKVKHWTPFDRYLISWQALCIFIISSFIVSKLLISGQARPCAVREIEFAVMAVTFALWIIWNVGFALNAYWVKQSELRRFRVSLCPDGEGLPRALTTGGEGSEGGRDSTASTGSLCSTQPFDPSSLVDETVEFEHAQVVSIAFRIWLVRNVDLVTATFECKFRVFFEWLDEAAKGLDQGKKVKLPVPEITITNAVQTEVLDRSSAPEVVNSETGHLAAQVLYRATLRMDQEVRLFPFDCQWLSINVSLRDNTERSRSFYFQYCEVEGQLQLDEWKVHSNPAFSTLTKRDSPSIQETVMCGILIRRSARYYVVNILFMLFLISSLAFTTYTIEAWEFWERAEVFLGIFPLIVIFKMSAQAKLPRVEYNTQFDNYANFSQCIFFTIVICCITSSLYIRLAAVWSACPVPDSMLSDTWITQYERYVGFGLILIWLAWNGYFTVRAWRMQHLKPLDALETSVPIRLQDAGWVKKCSTRELSIDGLAPRVSAMMLAGHGRDGEAVFADSTSSSFVRRGIESVMSLRSRLR